MADKKTIAAMSVRIGADTKRFNNAMSRTQRRLKSISNQFKQVAGAIVVAFSVGAIVKFGRESLKAFDVQKKAEAQLLTSLKGRRDAQERLIRQAQDLQKVTLFGDEETIKAQALIAAFVKEEDQIKKVIPLVQDLAAAKGMSLAAAADMVSKTLGSSTNALARYGIEVHGAVGSSERLGSLMKNLDTAFAGQAKTLAQSGIGAVQQLSNTWGDLQETMGGLLAGGILPLAKGMSSIVSGFDALIKMPLSKQMEDQRTKVDALTLSLFNANLEEENKKRIWDEINRIAPEVLDGIKQESINYEVLKSNLREYNKEMLNRIVLQIEQEKVDAAAARQNKKLQQQAEQKNYLMRKMSEEVEKVRKKHTELADQMSNVLTVDVDLSDIEKAQKIQKIVDEFNKKINTEAKKRGVQAKYSELALVNLHGAINVASSRLREYEDASKDVTTAEQKRDAMAAMLNLNTVELTDAQKDLINQYNKAFKANKDYTKALTTEEELKLRNLGITSDLTQAQKNLIDQYNKAFKTQKDYASVLSAEEELKLKNWKADSIATGVLGILNQKIEEQKGIIASAKPGELEKIARANDLIDSYERQIEALNNLSLVDRDLKLSPMDVDLDVNVQTHQEIQAQDMQDQGITYKPELAPMDDLYLGLQNVNDIFSQLGDNIQLAKDKGEAFGDSMGSVHAQISATQQAMEALIENGISPQSTAVGILKERLKELTDEAKEMEVVAQMNAILSASIADVITVGVEAVMNGEDAFAAIKESMANFMGQMGKMFLAYGVASEAFQKALGEPITMIIAGVALIAISSALKASASQGPDKPQLAEGGVVTSPTSAMVGEYPGASKNPEVGMPFDVFEKLFGSKVDIFKSPTDTKIGKSADKQNPYIIAPFSKLLAGDKIPELAEGGVVTSPTSAMVGEYPGASKDPEVGMPFDVFEKLFGSKVDIFKSPTDTKIGKSADKQNPYIIAPFSKLLAGDKIPKLAEGGIATGPTLAMVGDNMNAAIDPEIISPLSELKKMFDFDFLKDMEFTPPDININQSFTPGGFSQDNKIAIEITGEGIITHDAIYFAYKNAKHKRERIG